MRKTDVLTCAVIALAIAGCERRERNRANEMGNAQAGQPAMRPPASPRPDASAGATGAAGGGGLRVDSQALVQACLDPADVNRPLSTFSDEEKRAMVVCANREAARQANAQLPMRVDDVTTVTSITADGLTVVYNVRLDLDAANLPAGARARLEANARANACARQDMRQTMGMGGAYAYVWSDRAGRPILRFRIDGC
jgi:hypothetical protein